MSWDELEEEAIKCISAPFPSVNIGLILCELAKSMSTHSS